MGKIFSGYAIPKNLDELFVHGKEAAAHIFNEAGEVLPMWIMQDSSAMLTPVCASTAGMDKDKTVKLVKRTIKEVQATRIVFIGESWMISAKTKEEINRLTNELSHTAISDHPDKMEVIFVTAEDKFHCKTGYFPINRIAGKASLGEFTVIDEATEFGGTFSNLLADSVSLQ